MRLSPSRSTLLWYGVPIGIFLFALLYVFLTTRVDLSSPTIASSSSFPLIPKLPLQLAAGEKYSYSYSFFGEPATSTYTITALQPPCAYVEGSFTSNFTNFNVRACIDMNNGSVRSLRVLDESGKQQQANGTLEFVQPFMLALDENWRWHQNTSVVFDARLGIGENDVATYESGLLTAYRGRRAFNVTVTSERYVRGSLLARTTQTLYVDQEKRVLLLADSPEVRIELVSAPFNLTG